MASTRHIASFIGILLTLMVTFFDHYATADSNPLYRSRTFLLNPLVPLTHCTKLGVDGEFLFEWQLNLAPKWTMELRFSANIQRGFSAVGFNNGTKQQLILGYPVENMDCARSLWDNFSPYDQYGNVYPNFPEVPGKITWTNISHAVHYLMRNLSITSRTFLSRNGGAAQLNVTLMWAFMQRSLFEAGCYMGTLNSLTEYANFNLSLADPYYLRQSDGTCRDYEGLPKPANGRILDDSNELLIGEAFQNTRAAVLFLGGDLLVDAGSNAPTFDGYVRGGDNGVCSASTTTVYAQWSGFHQPIGGIVKYLVTIGTSDLPSLYVDRYDVGTSTSLTKSVGNLLKNVSYIVRVTALDFAGLSITVASRSIYVLNNNAPIVGTVYISDSAGVRLKYQKSTTTLNARLVGWIAADHSAQNMITDAYTDNGFSYAVGDYDVGITSVLGWTSVATWRTSLTINGLDLKNNKKYTISIRSTNCAGKTTQFTTESLIVDSTPPAGGIIRVGNNTKVHAPYMTLKTKIVVWWWGFTDYISGIGGYEWAISRFPTPPSLNGGVGMVKPWQSVGLATKATNTTLSKFPGSATLIGHNIYFHVKVLDNVGNYLIKTSNATKVVAG